MHDSAATGSSAYEDLKDHREAVTLALCKIGYDVRCMEDYVATDERQGITAGFRRGATVRSLSWNIALAVALD